ncbi:MAG: NADH-quinone oxidoreductase subunit NuoE [Planctomycetota bacterium]|nr:NADH-quinone oxidoreductase subunit NuoE [Planctomycetota bacterium]
MANDSLSSILDSSRGTRDELIPILQKTQQKHGFISTQAVKSVARKLKISENEVYGVATFYAQFRFNPPGKHHIRICMGTACHVKGGEQLMATIDRKYGIGPGETTEDGLFDLERVACLGCCALAPVIKVDDTVYGHMNVLKLQQILGEYERSSEKTD